MAVGTIGQVGRVLARVRRTTDDAVAPWMDLAIRLWLTQLLWASGLHAFVSWPDAVRQASLLAPGWLLRPEALAMGLAGVPMLLAPLLMLGFATRLACLPLCATFLLAAFGAPGRDAPVLWALLAGWYVIVGPGALSFDALIARGIFDSALPWARPLGRALRSLGRVGRPWMLLLVRLGLAAVLSRHGMMAHGAQIAVPGLLAAGFLTRIATLPLLLATGAATMHAASNEHIGWMLLLLLVLTRGAGPVSVDAVLGAAARRWWPAMRAAAAVSGPHVVIVGGGFAGIAAARGLRNAACTVTLIDRHNHHVFQPLLYQVATASLSPADIATPIRALFRSQDNLQVRLAAVEGVDTQAKHVQLADGTRIAYDTLVLATGARHGYFGRDAWEAHAPGLKTIDDALAIRRRLLLAFERAEAADDAETRRALLTFAIIGGGPTGVELAGAVAELACHGLTGEFRRIDPAAARVILVQAGDRLLPTFPRRLSAAAAASLQELGVELRIGTRVAAVDATGIVIGDERIACGTSFWAAGVTASPAAAWLGTPGDGAGRVMVTPELSVPGLPDVFAVGDTALVHAWQGAAVPGLAPAAKQAGAHVAQVISARLAGRAGPPPFRYRHAGSLATIGRRAAVADFGRVRMKGAAAWWLWGAVHVLFLAGARNRIVVAVQWFWAYLTYGRGIRLITGGTL